jgi:hypothetical protein
MKRFWNWVNDKTPGPLSNAYRDPWAGIKAQLDEILQRLDERQPKAPRRPK